MCYGIIDYERDQHSRTLINKLVSCISWVVIINEFTLSTGSLLLLTFGPLPSFLCYFDQVMRPTVIFQIVLLLDSILVTRYMFIFHMKNPTAAQDDFWSFFLFIWSFSAALLTHIVFVLLPGHNTALFYICLGRYPAGYDPTNKKKNIAINLLMLVSFVLHILAAVRYFYFKYQEKRQLLPQVATPVHIHICHINEATLTGLLSNFCAITMLFCSSYVAFRMVSIDHERVNEFSEFVWIYIYTLYLHILMEGLGIINFFVQNPAARGYFIRTFVHSQIGQFLREIGSHFSLFNNEPNVIEMN